MENSKKKLDLELRGYLESVLLPIPELIFVNQTYKYIYPMLNYLDGFLDMFEEFRLMAMGIDDMYARTELNIEIKDGIFILVSFDSVEDLEEVDEVLSEFRQKPYYRLDYSTDIENTRMLVLSLDLPLFRRAYEKFKESKFSEMFDKDNPAEMNWINLLYRKYNPNTGIHFSLDNPMAQYYSITKNKGRARKFKRTVDTEFNLHKDDIPLSFYIEEGEIDYTLGKKQEIFNYVNFAEYD